MPRFQFSLRALLGAAVFVAVACSTLLYASATIASVVFTVTVVVLLAAVVAALCRRGAARAFWVGFAIFGWGYLWLAHWPEPNTGIVIPAGGPWGSQEYQGLATTQLMSYTYDALLPLVRTPPPQPYGPVYGTPGPGYGAPARFYSPPPPSAVAPVPTPWPPATGSGDPFGGASPALLPPSPVAPAPAPPAPVPITSSYPSYFAFIHVGHSLWAWLFALFGALLARHCYATREKKPPPPSPPAAS